MQQFQPLSDITSHQLETALRVAKVSLDSTERLVQLQLETARQTLEDSSKGVSGASDVQSIIKLRTDLTSHLVDSFVAFSRGVYEVSTQAQQEFARIAEDNLTDLNKSVVSNVDKASKSAPAGSEQFISMFKQSFAVASAAVDSLTKATKQVSEFADASVKAATSATAEAVKSAARSN